MSVVAPDVVGQTVGDIEVAVGSESQPTGTSHLRPLRKDAIEHSGDAVVPQHLPAVAAADVEHAVWATLQAVGRDQISAGCEFADERGGVVIAQDLVREPAADEQIATRRCRENSERGNNENRY